MGTLERIWIKRGRRGAMDPASSASLIAGRGIAGNANQRGKRQVTLLALERWEATTSHLPNLDPILRRANMLVSGIDLTASRGRVLRIGPCRIRIHGETRPCKRMDDACLGLRAALGAPWAGGAFGEVLNDGEIEVGDAVRWDEIRDR